MRGEALFGVVLVSMGCAQPVPYITDQEGDVECFHGCRDPQGTCHIGAHDFCGYAASACVACGVDEACHPYGRCEAVAGTMRVEWLLSDSTPCPLPDSTVVRTMRPFQQTPEVLGTVPCSAGVLVAAHVPYRPSTLIVDVVNASGEVELQGSASIGSGPVPQVQVSLNRTDALLADYEITVALPDYRAAAAADCLSRDMALIRLFRSGVQVASTPCADLPLRVKLPARPAQLRVDAINLAGVTRGWSQGGVPQDLPLGTVRPVALPLEWAVGRLEARWGFQGDAGVLTCAQAGVSEVQLDLPRSQTLTVPCEDDAGVAGVAIEFANAGGYTTVGATSSNGARWLTSGYFPAAGVFEGAVLHQLLLRQY